ncbi:MAG: hypothetical protein CVU41_18440 [Chloroflexi bacterium HGW-Chloroflexi-3]|nr:MAG: hypothetical protein CVU41_18440 [Chloroflexi bacterium HGW-Chloroflexi-3]
MIFSLCICTYKRVFLLKSLLEDLSRQSKQPDNIIIVDGDPKSKEILSLLTSEIWPKTWKILYVPSNHSNLSYQRYLGWKKASQLKSDYLIYFDDDLRLSQKNIIEKIITHLIENNDVVGATTEISMGEFAENQNQYKILIDRKPKSLMIVNALKMFGGSSKIKPGGLSPTGNRILPLPKEDSSFSEVLWLRGGVMAYKMSAITQDCFLDDLFALDEKRFGKGEDTILSRKVMQNGKLIYLHDVVVDHPNVDLPKTYPTAAFKLAYATAYSRRFLNDHYRITNPPNLKDRMALLKSYFGNSIINWWQAFSTFKKNKLLFALGYSFGALRGIFQKPTSENLTPNINWWQDAEEALKNQILIQ